MGVGGSTDRAAPFQPWGPGRLKMSMRPVLASELDQQARRLSWWEQPSPTEWYRHAHEEQERLRHQRLPKSVQHYFRSAEEAWADNQLEGWWAGAGCDGGE